MHPVGGPGCGYRHGRGDDRLGGAAGDATPGGFGAATAGFSVNGMRNQSNNFLLDGASNNDTFNTGFVMRPPPDAIQEFKVMGANYPAEYGRSLGSVLNVVYKSGSNDFQPHPVQADGASRPVRRERRGDAGLGERSGVDVVSPNLLDAAGRTERQCLELGLRAGPDQCHDPRVRPGQPPRR